MRLNRERTRASGANRRQTRRDRIRSHKIRLKAIPRHRRREIRRQGSLDRGRLGEEIRRRILGRRRARLRRRLRRRRRHRARDRHLGLHRRVHATSLRRRHRLSHA